MTRNRARRYSTRSSPSQREPPLTLARLKDTNKKPQYPLHIIAQAAILSSPRKLLLLHEIREYIMKKFPYFRRTHKWKDSLRHVLSYRSAFRQVKREDHEPGIGDYWTFDEGVTGYKRLRKRGKKPTKARSTRVSQTKSLSSTSPSPSPSPSLSPMSSPSPSVSSSLLPLPLESPSLPYGPSPGWPLYYPSDNGACRTFVSATAAPNILMSYTRTQESGPSTHQSFTAASDLRASPVSSWPHVRPSDAVHFGHQTCDEVHNPMWSLPTAYGPRVPPFGDPARNSAASEYAHHVSFRSTFGAPPPSYAGYASPPMMRGPPDDPATPGGRSSESVWSLSPFPTPGSSGSLPLPTLSYHFSSPIQTSEPLSTLSAIRYTPLPVRPGAIPSVTTHGAPHPPRREPMAIRNLLNP